MEPVEAPSLESLPPKVFISYSHADRPFVERLANDLLLRRILVWWDEWEIKVGESLLQKLQEGISTASNLVVVLSPNSVESPWVTEELNAALTRQLRERRVIVLPVLVEDCQIPPFLQDKRYADFRESYEFGLGELVASIRPPDLQSHARGDVADYHNDLAFDWGLFRDLHAFRIVVVSHGINIPYVISCVISVVSNDIYTARLNEMQEAGFDWAPRTMLLMFSNQLAQREDPVIVIEGDQEAVRTSHLVDPNHETAIDLEVRARRLGQDPGDDILYEWRSVFDYATNHHREGIRSALSASDMKRFEEWLAKNPV